MNGISLYIMQRTAISSSIGSIWNTIKIAFKTVPS